MANALIERRGARTALVTSQGAKDIIETGKENRYNPYDRLLTKPAPLVPRPWRRTLAERLLAGRYHVSPWSTPAEVAQVLKELVVDGVEAVAICLLHSYANPRHEQAVRAVAESLGLDVYLSLSSEVAPENRRIRTNDHYRSQRLHPTHRRRVSATASGSATRCRPPRWLLPDVVRQRVRLDRGHAAKLPSDYWSPGPAAGVLAAGT